MGKTKVQKLKDKLSLMEKVTNEMISAKVKAEKE